MRVQSAGASTLQSAAPVSIVCRDMQANLSSPETPTLSSCVKRRMVWGPLAVGAIASFAISWHLIELSPSSSYGSRAPVYMAWAAISAIVAGTSGFAWIRACIAKQPTLVCAGCEYDLRGRGSPSAPCPECGSALRRTEAPALGSYPSGLWILLPGVLLLLGAAACAAYSVLLLALWVGGALA